MEMHGATVKVYNLDLDYLLKANIFVHIYEPNLKVFTSDVAVIAFPLYSRFSTPCALILYSSVKNCVKYSSWFLIKCRKIYVYVYKVYIINLM
jgi:hypothetical protein